MGAASSKAARGAATRKYPARASGAAVTRPVAPRAQQPADKASFEAPSAKRDEAIQADGMDPDYPSGDFARRLHQMGVVQPNPTYSPSSTVMGQRQLPRDDPSSSSPLGPMFPPASSNPALSVLAARRRIQQLAEEDFEAMGRANHTGKQFVDMRTLVDAMGLLDRGLSRRQVEKELRLQPNLLSKLGPAGVFTHIASDKAPKVDQW